MLKRKQHAPELQERLTLGTLEGDVPVSARPAERLLCPAVGIAEQTGEGRCSPDQAYTGSLERQQQGLRLSQTTR